MLTHRFFIAVSLTLIFFTCLPTIALERTFPPHAKRAVITIENYPGNSIFVTLNDGTIRTLSAQTQIKNSNNLIELPSYLKNGSFAIYYTENIQGDIDRIWLLNKDEEQHPPNVN